MRTTAPPASCRCDTHRRQTLGALGALGVLSALGTAVLDAGAATREAAADVLQPAAPGPAAFMARAFEMRRIAVERGDQPYGAVLVLAGRIVGEGVSAVITSSDPTAHAERQAIRDAARRLGTTDLRGSELYGTSRACAMCETAAARARVSRMLHGESVTDAGEPRERL